MGLWIEITGRDMRELNLLLAIAPAEQRNFARTEWTIAVLENFDVFQSRIVDCLAIGPGKRTLMDAAKFLGKMPPKLGVCSNLIRG